MKRAGSGPFMEGAPPPWNLSAPKEDAEATGPPLAPLPVSLTLSGDTSAYRTEDSATSSSWAWGTFFRFAGVVLAVHVLLGGLMLTTAVQVDRASSPWEYTETTMELNNGSGSMSLDEKDGLLLVDVWAYEEQDGLSGYGSYWHMELEGWYERDDPTLETVERTLVLNRQPPIPEGITLAMEHDAAARTLWFNGTAISDTTYLGGGISMYDGTGAWRTLELEQVGNQSALIDYGNHTDASICELGTVSLNFKHPDQFNHPYDELHLYAWPDNCWRSNQASDGAEYIWEFSCQCDTLQEPVGAWTPANRTLWVSDSGLEDGALFISLEFTDPIKASSYDTASTMHGVMLTVFPIGCILSYIVVPILGGRRHGQSGVYGGLAGLLLAPVAFIAWLVAIFVGW